MKKIKLDMVHRRLWLAYVDGLGTLLYHAYGEYDRGLRYYGKKGLTPGELAYAQKRADQMKQVADDMAELTHRVRNHINGTLISKGPRR